jgi:hypothetical protein
MARSTRTRKRKGSSKKVSSTRGRADFDPDHLALQMEEIRRLALQITNDGDVEKFIRRMILLIDDFKRKQTGKVRQVARQSKDPAFVRLMSAISAAAKEGRLRAANNTAFYAANYAFQNSIEYVRVFMSYLDSLSQNQGQA